MNTEVPPFDNVEVRRAVAAAINRDHIVQLRPMNLTAASQVLPRDVPGYDPTFVGQRYDYPAALEHMRKAGYAYDPVTGKGGWPKIIPYLLTSEFGLAQPVAQLVQQDLAKIGLRIELRMVTFAAFVALVERRGESPMSEWSWRQDFPDPSNFFDPLFGTASVSDEGSQNKSFYSNPQLDELLVQAHRELDNAKRMALYGKANRIVANEAPSSCGYSYHYFVVHQPYVRNFHRHPVWEMEVSRVWLDRASGGLLAGERALGALLGPSQRAP
jgi:ABC-type transport system substrate-binding protein